MENNILQDVLSVLVNVKVELQKSKVKVYQELVKKIDVCISKVAPMIDVFASYSQKQSSNNTLLRDRSTSQKQLSTFQKKFQIRQINYQKQKEQLQKVRKGFLKEGDSSEMDQNLAQKQDVIIDYFMFKYDFKLKQHIILGRQGGEKSDRNVFLDLFTEQKSKNDFKKIQKTESMTNILKAIYTPDKIGQPFILPNCQGEKIKYLFLFGLHECGCIDTDFFKTQTLYCFITRQFILRQLTNLMDSIAKICFEKRVSQISPNEDPNFHQIVENLNAKKTFLAIQEGIEEFLKNFKQYDLQESTSHQLNMSISRMERWNSNSLDHYLQRSSLRWSSTKKSKSKQVKYYLTLVMLFYFTICQYKIIMVCRNESKHIISELIIGLINALQPLTFIYPIVTATITPHHMEFTNSPVPLLIGVWGPQQYYNYAKSSFKKFHKNQKNLSISQLQRQTNMVFFDLEDHTVGCLDIFLKQTLSYCQKIQNHIEIKYQGSISQRLHCFLTELLVTRDVEMQPYFWINQLRKKVRQTQMYQFLTSKERI